jgi:hypothetical protein
LETPGLPRKGPDSAQVVINTETEIISWPRSSTQNGFFQRKPALQSEEIAAGRPEIVEARL